MSFLLLLRPHREGMPEDPTPEEARIVGEHFDHLSRLRDEGKLLVAGPSIVDGDTYGSRL